MKQKVFNNHVNIIESVLNQPLKIIDDWASDTIGVGQLIAESESIKNALTSPEDNNKLDIASRFLANTIKKYPYYVDISLIYLINGNEHIQYGSELLCASYISRQHDALNSEVADTISEIIKGKAYYFGIVYKSEHTGEIVLPLGMPVFTNGKLIGAIIIESKPDHFLKYLDVPYLKKLNTRMAIIDERGKVLAHINKSMIFDADIEKYYRSLIDPTKNGMYIKEMKLNGIDEYYFLIKELYTEENSQYTKDSWYMMADTPKSEINKMVWIDLNRLLRTNLLYLLIILTIVYIFNKIIVYKPLKITIASIKAIASGSGDLTRKLSVKEKDEFYLLVNYYNQFMDTITGIIVNVKSLINTVSSSSAQVSSSMEETSRTIEEQTGQLTEVASTLEELTVTGNSISDIVKENKEDVSKARDKTYNGSQTLQSVSSLIEQVKENSSNLSRQLSEFTKSTSKIDSILIVINDIADQTNLLALNAAIEAARAGEAGRGFAVVAEEVRKLAEKTTSSTKEINEIIRSIAESNTIVQNQMDETSISVDKSIIEVNNADKIFKEIVNIVDKVYNGTEHIGSTIEEQINALTKGNDNIQVISSASEETSRAVAEVTTTITHLQKELEQLKALIDNFKTN